VGDRDHRNPFKIIIIKLGHAPKNFMEVLTHQHPFMLHGCGIHLQQIALWVKGGKYGPNWRIFITYQYTYELFWIYFNKKYLPIKS